MRVLAVYLPKYTSFWHFGHFGIVTRSEKTLRRVVLRLMELRKCYGWLRRLNLSLV